MQMEVLAAIIFLLKLLNCVSVNDRHFYRTVSIKLKIGGFPTHHILADIASVSKKFDSQLLNKYRQITILSAISKTFESNRYLHATNFNSNSRKI